MAPGIYGFSHMVVRLADLDAGIAAYSKLFPPGPREVVENDSMGLKAAIFLLPNGGAIEIVAPTSPHSVLHSALAKDGPGMNLMAYQCEDLAATIDMMKRNGVRVIEDDPTHIMVHPKSTHGVLMQLVEKAPTASVANRAGQVRDVSGIAGGIVSYKCTVIFVHDVDVAIASYEKLGLKLTFRIPNNAAGSIQAGFFLRGGGIIELIGPLNVSNAEDSFVKFMKTRGEGFQHLSLDGSTGVVDELSKAGIKTKVTDPEHADIHKDATLTRKMLLQINPVGMGTKHQVKLTAMGKL